LKPFWRNQATHATIRVHTYIHNKVWNIGLLFLGDILARPLDSQGITMASNIKGCMGSSDVLITNYTYLVRVLNACAFHKATAFNHVPPWRCKLTCLSHASAFEFLSWRLDTSSPSLVHCIGNFGNPRTLV
jgi:hypothetical protein